MVPIPDDVRVRVRSAPGWESLHLVHRGTLLGEVEAWLRHGEVEVRRLSDGGTFRDTEAPGSSWTVRPLEPIYQSYLWAAMLDPYELGDGVAISDLRTDQHHGRPVWRFHARAEEGYEPICSCCPLIFSAITERYEYGEDWVPPAGVTLPEGVEIALDLGTGIVVSSCDVGGTRGGRFDNQILSAS